MTWCKVESILTLVTRLQNSSASLILSMRRVRGSEISRTLGHQQQTQVKPMAGPHVWQK